MVFAVAPSDAVPEPGAEGALSAPPASFTPSPAAAIAGEKAVPVNSSPPVATVTARLRLAKSYMGTSTDQSEEMERADEPPFRGNAPSGSRSPAVTLQD